MSAEIEYALLVCFAQFTCCQSKPVGHTRFLRSLLAVRHSFINSGTGSSPFMTIFESSRKRGKVGLRRKELLRAAACWFLVAQLAGMPLANAADDKGASTTAAANTASDPVLTAMRNELARATTELGKAEQPPYYLSYTVYDQDF